MFCVIIKRKNMMLCVEVRIKGKGGCGKLIWDEKGEIGKRKGVCWEMRGRDDGR